MTGAAPWRRSPLRIPIARRRWAERLAKRRWVAGQGRRARARQPRTHRLGQRVRRRDVGAPPHARQDREHQPARPRRPHGDRRRAPRGRPPQPAHHARRERPQRRRPAERVEGPHHVRGDRRRRSAPAPHVRPPQRAGEPPGREDAPRNPQGHRRTLRRRALGTRDLVGPIDEVDGPAAVQRGARRPQRRGRARPDLHTQRLLRPDDVHPALRRQPDVAHGQGVRHGVAPRPQLHGAQLGGEPHLPRQTTRRLTRREPRRQRHPSVARHRPQPLRPQGDGLAGRCGRHCRRGRRRWYGRRGRRAADRCSHRHELTHRAAPRWPRAHR
jgi:hypothetical protein